MQNQTIQDVTIRPLIFHQDQRGWLVELFRFDELREHEHPVMSYVSMTFPGYSRGPHEHREQTDVFGFFGPGDMTLYLWDARPEYHPLPKAVFVGRSGHSGRHYDEDYPQDIKETADQWMNKIDLSRFGS